MGELARAGRTASTRDAYSRHLNKLIDHLERAKPDPDAREVTVNDCRTFLDNWIGASNSTVCTVHSAMMGLFKWLYLEGEIDENPMLRVARPRRQRPEDVVGGHGHYARRSRRCLPARGAGRSSSALTILAYTGVRRDAASRLRWKDVDLDAGTVTFRDKGSKYAERPISDDLVAILQGRARVRRSRLPAERLRDPEPARARPSAERSGPTR